MQGMSAQLLLFLTETLASMALCWSHLLHMQGVRMTTSCAVMPLYGFWQPKSSQLLALTQCWVGCVSLSVPTCTTNRTA
jgi:hypothetical protein